MFLPISDSPNPRGTPVVTWALIAVNVVVYLLVSLPLTATRPAPDDPLLREYVEVLVHVAGVPPSELVHVTAYDLFVFDHGYRPVDADWADLIVSMFLHAGLMHLVGNMLFLWIYGDNVEHRLGRIAFLVAYLGTGCIATLTHAAFDAGSPLPMIGASGAISGVLGFYFLFFPRNVVRLLVALFPFFVDVIVVPARLVLGFYLLIDNLLPFLVTSGAGGGGVAYGAHLGGFVAGLGAAWVIDRRERDVRPREYRRPARPAQPATSPAAEVSALVARDRWPEAAEAYFAADEAIDHELASGDALALGAWLAQNGHPSAALSVFRRVLRRHPRGPAAARAHVGAGWVQLRSLGRPTAAWQHFLDALDLERTGESADLARRGIAAIEAMRPPRRFGPRS